MHPQFDVPVTQAELDNARRQYTDMLCAAIREPIAAPMLAIENYMRVIGLLTTINPTLADK